MPAGIAQPQDRGSGSERRPRVLIVDDSAVARAVIGRAVESGRMQVAGAVSSAGAALDFLAHEQVDGIVLDIEMPQITGLVALPDILAAGRGAKVLIVSSAATDGAAATLEALALGAADTLVKPAMGTFTGRFSQTIVDKLSRLLDVQMTPQIGAAEAMRRCAPEFRAPLPDTAPLDAFGIVAIGASTGGIHALNLLLRELPRDFTVPILITQHLPPSFMTFFAAQIAVLADRPCDVATDLMRIRPGRIIVAPGTAHLRVVSTGQGAAIRLSHASAKSGCMPSVDPMLESVAEVFGERGLGVVLSGMGRDGLEGARSLIERGGAVVVQDRASSVVWGMPGAIANAGLASAVLSPAEIGRFVGMRRRPA